MTKLMILFSSLILISCSSVPKDEFIWLENIEGLDATAWVTKETELTKSALSKDPLFQKRYNDALKIYESKDRITYPIVHGSTVYNFWKDKKNIRGILRRQSVNAFLSRSKRWETVLDIDRLAKKENENWVYKGINCLQPQNEVCLVILSRGGTDASVYKEFNLKNKKFVNNGFFIPEAKTRVSWLDKNRLVVGTNFGEGSLTDSGYPRVLKVLSRGQKLSSATPLFEGKTSDTLVVPFYFLDEKLKKRHMLSQALDFYNTNTYFMDKGLKPVLIQKPTSMVVAGWHMDKLFLEVKKPILLEGKNIKDGSLILADLNQKTGDLSNVITVWSPSKSESLSSFSKTKNFIVLNILENVKNKIYKISLKSLINSNKIKKELVIGQNSISSSYVMGASSLNDHIFVSQQGFKQSSSLLFYNLSSKRKKLIQKKPVQFKDKNIVVKQQWASSKDGTKIPYFIMHNKDLELNGKNKTLLYGYGGFEVSLKPRYPSVEGKLWLEQGNVYVIANIRGGGEFGPSWHQAALKNNRQKAYDDFIAVAEDLISKKVTTSKSLGIMGGSNGGLLVGAVMTQRPELFNAVVCQVPLLDMLRFNKLLAGASWMGEYGNPDVKKERKYILEYSPYQNLSKNKSYPAILLYTSTKDDRVHPGHARKMAARMKKMGHTVLYYENTEGGHAASTNQKQRATAKAISFTFLNKYLGSL